MIVRRRKLLILALLPLAAFTQRPSFPGQYAPSPNGSATSIGYIQDPLVFVNQGAAFGNLGRNAVAGPEWSDLDIVLTKNPRINERVTLQFRADAFASLNQINFTNPGTTVGSSTLAIITGETRYAAGDFGASRQMQMSAKLIF